MQSKYTVLVVDDEPKIIEVVQSFLENKNYEVFTALNAKEAFKIFERERISLILLDLMLPDMNGEDICMKIRQQSRIPIIMLTAKVEEENMLKGLNIGADDYITKPFSLKMLLARIEAVLRRTGDELIPLYAVSVFNGGELIVDFNKMEIKKSQKLVSLTPNEFKLLSCMIKYPAKVFTRDELIEIIFGLDFFGYDRTIDSHIKNLRKKIETDPRNPVYIKTIHGVGYKFGGQ